MNARNRHLVNVVSTGILVLFVMLGGLFWLRWHLHLVRIASLQNGAVQAVVSPTGLFPLDKMDDPNIISRSSATARFVGLYGLFATLGAPQYFLLHRPMGSESNVYEWEPKEDGVRLYFDPSLGLLVYGGMSDVSDPNGTTRRRYVTLFAGPEGMAETPRESLGRFVSPIVDRYCDSTAQAVYDKGQRRFFSIRWRDGVVRKGPEIADEEGEQPIGLGFLEKNYQGLWVTQKDAVYKQPGGEGLVPRPARQPLGPRAIRMSSWPVLVLNASGRIDLLDLDTLTLRSNVGYIPTPPTLFERLFGSVPSKNVAAFCITPRAAYDREEEKKWAYIGCVVAAVSPDLTGVQLVAFDPNGTYVGAAASRPSPGDAYCSLPGASLLTAVQYVLENLHPTTTLLLSSLLSSQVPAQSAYQSLVLLPNSLAAMAARDTDFTRINRFAYSLVFMLPAIGLGVFLAWRISRDVATIGLAKRESNFWILGVFALGLPAYVTYRMTRPKSALVTCRNCGLGRRTDLEKCQRCGSAWDVPELNAPAWRVCSDPECDQEQTLPPAEEMNNSSAQ